MARDDRPGMDEAQRGPRAAFTMALFEFGQRLEELKPLMREIEAELERLRTLDSGGRAG